MILALAALMQLTVAIGGKSWTFSTPTQPPDTGSVIQIAPDTLSIGGVVRFKVKAGVSGYLDIRFPQQIPNLNLCTPDPAHDWTSLTTGSWAIVDCYPNWTSIPYQRWFIKNGVFIPQ